MEECILRFRPLSRDSELQTPLPHAGPSTRTQYCLSANNGARKRKPTDSSGRCICGLEVPSLFPVTVETRSPPPPVPFEGLSDTIPQLQKRSVDSGFLIATGNPDFLFLFVFLPQIFSQEYINLLLSMYFFVLGILALSHTIRSEGISATFEAAFSRASTGSRMRT